jgi:ribosome-binding factor A
LSYGLLYGVDLAVKRKERGAAMSRKEKVQDAIQKVVSSILANELKDPRLGFVTITGVEISPDLRYAKIFYSVLGKEQDHKKSKKALDSALKFIRKLVAERIQLRFAPEIVFNEDKSSEYSSKIQEVLDEIKQMDDARKKKETEEK